MILFNSASEDETKDKRSPLKQNNGSPAKDSPVKATRKGRKCRIIESDDEEEGTKEAEQENQSNSTDPVKVHVYYITAILGIKVLIYRNTVNQLFMQFIKLVHCY